MTTTIDDESTATEPIAAEPPAVPAKPPGDYRVRLGPLVFSPKGSLVLILMISLGVNVLLIVLVVIAALIRSGKL